MRKKQLNQEYSGHDQDLLNDATLSSSQKKKKRKKMGWLDILLIVLMVGCFAGGAFLLIKPLVIEHRQDEVTEKLNSQIEKGDLSPFVVDRDANKVEGEMYDFFGDNGYQGEQSINYDDLPKEVKLQPIARVQIPAINVDLPLLEGATHIQLRYGLAHVPDTAKPGEKGNCAVLGHRMLKSGRHLNRLNEVKDGDTVVVRTDKDIYTYRVFKMVTILPRELPDYIDKDYGFQTITLITCDPIPTWTHRILCIAKLESHKTIDGRNIPVSTYSTVPAADADGDNE